MRKISYGRKSQLSQPAHSLFSLCSGINYFQHKKEKIMNLWICPYISRHLLSLNPLLACCRRYSRGER
nr:hypothetical protein [Escherichia coli]